MQIKSMIMGMIERKLASYSPETVNMPFFRAIFTEEQIITASIIQSFYTSFGMSIYEQMAEVLARDAGHQIERQHELLGEIDPKTESLIVKIHTQLRKGECWDDEDPVKQISESTKPGKAAKDPDSVVDLLVKKGSEEYYFGITTVKPNKEGFSTHARKMLRWIALRLSQNKNAKVNVGVVIPYNPYEPQPYDRWDSRKMFGKQLYVGKDFWDFLGGAGAYEELLKIFKEVGNETRQQIENIGKPSQKAA